MLVVAFLSLALSGAAGASSGTALVDGIPQRGTMLGQKSARVTLIQYEDFGCSHCRAYTENAFPAIVREYVRTGLVKIDFRGLAVVTRASAPAMRYTVAAARQKKLWHVAQLFFENQATLGQVATDKGVRKLVRGVRGLDTVRLLADSKSPWVRKQIAAHAAEAKRRQVPGTPWFLVKIGNAPPKLVRPEAYDPDAFRIILDEALGR